jgi:hypothetical protein
MAPIPVALMAASAAMSAVGAITSGQAQSASYKSQANAERYNAAVEKQNAQSAEAAASANELAQRRQGNQIMGSQRARIAESGGGFTGTNIGVLQQNGANLEMDALNTQYSGLMQSRGLLAQANLDTYQAKAADINAKNATTGSYIGAAASALNSVSNYYNYKHIGGG